MLDHATTLKLYNDQCKEARVLTEKLSKAIMEAILAGEEEGLFRVTSVFGTQQASVRFFTVKELVRKVLTKTIVLVYQMDWDTDGIWSAREGLGPNGNYPISQLNRLLNKWAWDMYMGQPAGRPDVHDLLGD
jgi:hypothetical protein